jgi:hypothetical protein
MDERKISLNVSTAKHGCGRGWHKRAEAVYTTASLHERY